MRPTRMIWHTRKSLSRFRSLLPRSWQGQGRGGVSWVPAAPCGEVPLPALGDRGYPGLHRRMSQRLQSHRRSLLLAPWLSLQAGESP